MAITAEEFKAANKRGAAALARGPVARAARYDARRALVVIYLLRRLQGWRLCSIARERPFQRGSD